MEDMEECGENEEDLIGVKADPSTAALPLIPLDNFRHFLSLCLDVSITDFNLQHIFSVSISIALSRALVLAITAPLAAALLSSKAATDFSRLDCLRG